MARNILLLFVLGRLEFIEIQGYFYAHTIKDIKDYLMFSILKYRILYLIS